MKASLFLIIMLITTVSCKPNADQSKNETIETDSNKREQSESFMQEHSSKNSLDYEGTYQGTIPCADCNGIKTTVSLFKDGTFLRTVEYLGKEDDATPEEGEYIWNDKGSAISLETSNGGTQMYQVGENVLFHLDLEGNIITGDLAELYKLSKTSNYDEIENTKWILKELFGQKVELKENVKQAYVIFNNETSRLSGNNSCNRFNASYELKGMGRILINPVASTLMACKGTKIDAGFIEVLEKADNYTVVDGVLSLNKARMATLAKFEVL